jgi:hypothetical protein
MAERIVSPGVFSQENDQSFIAQGVLNLGANKERLDKFFDSLDHGYNDEMLIKHYKDKFEVAIDEDFVRKILTWYARLDLGEKIKKCMVEKGFCEFRAEL